MTAPPDHLAGDLAEAAALFGLEPVEVLPLPGERTRNARVTTPGGARVVLKLHPEHEAADVDLEVAALDSLAKGPAAGSCPESSGPRTVLTACRRAMPSHGR